MSYWKRYTAHGIYIVICLVLLVLVGNIPNKIDVTQGPAIVTNMYVPEQRDAPPFMFRWAAQDATITLPHPSQGLQIMTFTATTPLPDSLVTFRTQDMNIGTYAITNGLFRRYMVLAQFSPTSTETTMIMHSNHLFQYGRELAIGISTISLHAISLLTWPSTIYVLLVIYTVVVVSVWRISLPMTIGCYVLSVIYVCWVLYGNSSVTESWMYGYMVAVAMIVALVSLYSTSVAPPISFEAITYRPDIDGLRAIAVGAVVLYHFFPANVINGYIGVDVFFVISGYLISQILLRNFATNTFTFRDFYARRVRRIFPALTIMMVIVLIIGSLVLFPDEFQQLGMHMGEGTGFILNFVLYSEIGYFDPAVITKPLLHLWSLGVEEQFYIIWPVLLYLFRRRIDRYQSLIVTVSAVSFFCYIVLNSHDQIATFYWSITRFWEIGYGALLAYSALTAIPSNPIKTTSMVMLRNVQAWLGFALLIVSIMGIGCVVIPTVYALVIPIVATGLLIAAGSATWVNRRILANPLATGIGLISFPLYLWHWPVLSLSEIVSNHQVTTPMRWVLIGVSLILAVLTYIIVEKPLRFGRYRSVSHWKIAATTVSLGICAVGLVGTGIVPPYNTAAQSFPINDSLTPLLPDSPCLGINGIGVHCWSTMTANSSGTEYYFIGDSHANALAQTQPLRRNLTIYSVYHCLPFIGVELYIDKSTRPYGCDNQQRLPVFIKTLATHPSKNHRVILLIGRYSKIQSKESDHYQMTGSYQDSALVDVDAVFRQGLTNVLTQLTQLPNTTVVLVHQVPEISVVPQHCTRLQIIYGANATNCSVPRASIDTMFAHYKAVFAPVLAHFPMVQQYNPMDVLCTTDTCAIIQDNQRIYRDDNHVATYGATLVTNRIWERYP